MDNKTELKSTKVMKFIIGVVFIIAVALGIASYSLSSEENNANYKSTQSSPF